LKELSFEAKAYFAGSYNCAQATFLPFAHRYGLNQDVAVKIALPFGGGMSHTGKVCGVISGGLLAIGLVAGTSADDVQQKNACYELAKIFMTRFKALHGDINCPALLGYDINDPRDKARIQELNLYETRCSNYVGDAVLILTELLPIEL
jgi:C_GCAxxG_C_C family probable redox protein